MSKRDICFEQGMSELRAAQDKARDRVEQMDAEERWKVGSPAGTGGITGIRQDWTGGPADAPELIAAARSVDKAIDALLEAIKTDPPGMVLLSMAAKLLRSWEVDAKIRKL